MTDGIKSDSTPLPSTEVVLEGVRYRVEDAAVIAYFGEYGMRVLGFDILARLYAQIADTMSLEGVYVVGRV